MLSLYGLLPARPRGSHPVGMMSKTVMGPGDQPLETVLWFPAESAAEETAHQYAKTLKGRYAPNASFASHLGPRPLVVLAHGLRGSRFDLSWLAERLASEGAIAVSLDHPGTSAKTFDRNRAPRLWERVEHLRCILDTLLTDSTWAKRINSDAITAAGHSAGGSTLLVWAGASLDTARFAARFPEAGAVPKTHPADPRLRALLLLAPGTGRAFRGEDIARVTCPAFIVSGTADQDTPDRFNAEHYAAHLPQCEWRHVPGAGHYIFRPVGTLYARLRAPLLSVDAPGLVRADVHQTIFEWVRPFFRKHGGL